MTENLGHLPLNEEELQAPPLSPEQNAYVKSMEIFANLRANSEALGEKQEAFLGFLKKITSRLDIFQGTQVPGIHSVHNDIDQYEFLPVNGQAERIEFSHNLTTDGQGVTWHIYPPFPRTDVINWSCSLHTDLKNKSTHLQIQQNVPLPRGTTSHLLEGMYVDLFSGELYPDAQVILPYSGERGTWEPFEELIQSGRLYNPD